MKKIYYVIITIVSIVLQSCGGGGDGPAPVVVIPTPGAATLVFPVNNEECNTGESLSKTQSRVNFQWVNGADVTSSEVFVKNLLTDTEVKASSISNQMLFTILKDTPYKWWVISKSTETTETSKSPEWKFYNSGDAITTYAPFPAELVAPTNGVTITSSTVTLDWDGSDVDGDITSYDVYFGTVNPPTTLLGNVTASTSKIENVAVSTATYYWKVMTKDEAGNSSISELFEFKVE